MRCTAGALELTATIGNCSADGSWLWTTLANDEAPTMPNKATAFSRCASSRACSTTRNGASSTVTSLILRPLMPPAALTSSNAT